MKRVALSSLLFSAGILLLPQAAPAQSFAYNPTTDFSITNGNPNGVWSYGWMSVGFGPLNLLTNPVPRAGGNPVWAGWNYDYSPCIWNNLDGSAVGVPTGWLALHPGPGQQPIVLRWTAPAPGPVTVEGQFLPGDSGAMQVAVRLDGGPWWNALDSGTFSLQTNVVAGTTIDFTVYGGYGHGTTALTVLISTPAFILNLTRQHQTNTVTFTAPAEGTYTLQFAAGLAPPIQWTDLTTNLLLANQLFTFTQRSTNAAGFYRARRE